MRTFEDFSVGETLELATIPVSAKAIVAFAERYDPQVFHIDPESAKSSFFGTVIASGWHLCSLMMRAIYDGILVDAASMGSPGVDAVAWRKPVKAGETLKARAEVLKARPSASRPEMGIVTFLFTLSDTATDVVMTCQCPIMFARRSEEAVDVEKLDVS